MDLQSEKLFLIEQLARLQDVKIIDQIKSLLQENIAGSHPNGAVIAKSELIERAETANLAIKKGEITTMNDLEVESKTW